MNSYLVRFYYIDKEGRSGAVDVPAKADLAHDAMGYALMVARAKHGANDWKDITAIKTDPLAQPQGHHA